MIKDPTMLRILARWRWLWTFLPVVPLISLIVSRGANARADIGFIILDSIIAVVAWEAHDLVRHIRVIPRPVR